MLIPFVRRTGRVGRWRTIYVPHCERILTIKDDVLVPIIAVNNLVFDGVISQGMISGKYFGRKVDDNLLFSIKKLPLTQLITNFSGAVQNVGRG